MKWWCLAAAMLISWLLGTLAVADGDDAEQVLRRVVVPSREDPHGEVQIVRRGDNLIVRSLLFSPILKRVVGHIDAKEEKHWSMDSAGFVESQRYRERLYQVTLDVWQRFRERDDREQRRQALGIEFVRAPKQDRIILFLPQLTGKFGTLEIGAMEILDSWSVRGDYVKENMVEIVHDSFAMDRAQAGTVLESLWEETVR